MPFGLKQKYVPPISLACQISTWYNQTIILTNGLFLKMQGSFLQLKKKRKKHWTPCSDFLGLLWDYCTKQVKAWADVSVLRRVANPLCEGGNFANHHTSLLCAPMFITKRKPLPRYEGRNTRVCTPSIQLYNLLVQLDPPVLFAWSQCQSLLRF